MTPTEVSKLENTYLALKQVLDDTEKKLVRAKARGDRFAAGLREILDVPATSETCRCGVCNYESYNDRMPKRHAPDCVKAEAERLGGD